MRLTHRQIEVFRAVMQAGQVTLAAQWLHSSQPTLSRELARLEQVLGYALFERVRGRLQPTARALALLQEVQASYLGLDRIAATAQALRLAVQGRLQLAALPALTQVLVPEALAACDEGGLAGGVDLHPLESPALEAALAEQRFDLGLTERVEAPGGCALQPLLVADEVAVLPAGHPLAVRTRLEAGHFEGQPFVSLAPEDPYRLQIDAWFERAGVQRRALVQTPSAASVCALVRQGVGVAIVNPLSALAEAARTAAAVAEGAVAGGLVLRPLAVSIPFRVGLVLPELRSRHPGRDPLAAALQRAADAAVRRLQALGVAAEGGAALVRATDAPAAGANPNPRG